MINKDRTVRNWKNFCSLVVYEFGKRFNIEKEDDIIIVKTNIGDGIGVGIKFDDNSVKSSMTSINDLINKFSKALKKKDINVLWKWSTLYDNYVDFTKPSNIPANLKDGFVVLVLSICGNLGTGRVPNAAGADIEDLGDIYLCCRDRLHSSVEDAFAEDFDIDMLLDDLE